MADVITVSTGSAGSAGNVSADLQTYFSAKLLEVAERNEILGQFGEKVPVPSNSSRTIQFVREEKFAVSTTPTQLTEGVTPDALGITMNQFDAVLEQYGAVVRLTDLAELTAKHPVVERTVYLMGIQAAEIYDQLIFNVLAANTNVSYPNGKTSAATLVASDTLSYNMLVALEAGLQDQAAKQFGDGSYVTVVAPQVHASLLKDTTFLAAHQLVKPDSIYRGEVGSLAGMRVVRSNAPSFGFTAQTGSGYTSSVFTGFAIGQNAYQISDFQNLKHYMAAPGGQFDVLEQNRRMGWKFAFKTLITNPNWIITFFTAGNNSINHT